MVPVSSLAFRTQGDSFLEPIMALRQSSFDFVRSKELPRLDNAFAASMSFIVHVRSSMLLYSLSVVESVLPTVAARIRLPLGLACGCRTEFELL